MSACTRYVDKSVTRCEGITIGTRMQCVDVADGILQKCSNQPTSQCVEYADNGAYQCSNWEDQGHNQCCDWWPCSWACDVFYWVAGWFCQAWYWVAGKVCLAWTWFVFTLVCQFLGFLFKVLCSLITYLISAACTVIAGVVRIICVVLKLIACAFSPSKKSNDQRIQHVFVLMLENRSFDHMLGFSGIEGIDGLTGNSFSNIDPLNQNVIYASTPADFKLLEDDSDTVSHGDPGHEFADTVEQLCGYHAQYDGLNHIYPYINNSGFVANRRTHNSSYPGKPMECYVKEQLPVITQLAKEFALCEHFYSSIPGPTWPNRFFMHAATSGGLDDSPSKFREVSSTLLDGFRFENGSFYDLLDDNCIPWMVFRGDSLPQIISISGMSTNLALGKIRSFDDFDQIVNDPNFQQSYVFIEPNYGNVLPPSSGDFTCGNSQHPLDDITRGEKLIKKTYETIRNSPHWNNSVLFVTYDEHGGFYDHVHPPQAPAPGDTITDPTNNTNGFDFTQFGVRVPCIVVSPFVQKNTIDGSLYSHASILATFESLFNINPLTERDRLANNFNGLFSLSTPRTDAPNQLADAADSGFSCTGDNSGDSAVSFTEAEKEAQRPIEPLMRGFLHVAFLRQYHSLLFGRDKLIREYFNINNSLDAKIYINKIKRRFNQNDAKVQAEKKPSKE